MKKCRSLLLKTLIFKLLCSICFIIIINMVCVDRKNAIEICNYTGQDLLIYQDVECLINEKSKYEDIYIGTTRLVSDSLCVRFINMLSECSLSWWERRSQDCDSFFIRFYLSRKTDTFLKKREDVRRISYDSVIITKHMIEKILPECRIIIK